jgi:hypothetical protein
MHCLFRDTKPIGIISTVTDAPRELAAHLRARSAMGVADYRRARGDDQKHSQGWSARTSALISIGLWIFALAQRRDNTHASRIAAVTGAWRLRRRRLPQ